MDPQLLTDFIKEDRTEIRTIKSRIYTYIHVLIAASLSITAFLISKETRINNDSIKWILLILNASFLLISWVFFYFQKKDLDFTRRCLQTRENMLKETTKDDYFPPCEEGRGKCYQSFLNWLYKLTAPKSVKKKVGFQASKKFEEDIPDGVTFEPDIDITEYEGFENDTLLWIPMFILTMIYVGVIVFILIKL